MGLFPAGLPQTELLLRWSARQDAGQRTQQLRAQPLWRGQGAWNLLSPPLSLSCPVTAPRTRRRGLKTCLGQGQGEGPPGSWNQTASHPGNAFCADHT